MVLKDEDLYGMIISERFQFKLETLRDIAIENAKTLAPDIKIENQEFAEWEEVYPNHFYGTLNAEIERIWSEGNHVIFDIDVQGGLNLKKKFGDRALALFVQPPTIEELARRLTARNTDSEEKLKMRIAKAADELKFAPKFDYVLINDNLDDAKSEIEAKVKSFL